MGEGIRWVKVRIAII